MINYTLYNEAISKLAISVFEFIGKPSPEEYAKAVKELHNPDVMQRILEERIRDIENDSKLSRSEKEARKNDVLSRYLSEDIKHIHDCSDVIDKDLKNKSEVANKIILGIVVGSAVFGAACGIANGIQNYTDQLQIVPNTPK